MGESGGDDEEGNEDGGGGKADVRGHHRGRGGRIGERKVVGLEHVPSWRTIRACADAAASSSVGSGGPRVSLSPQQSWVRPEMVLRVGDVASEGDTMTTGTDTVGSDDEREPNRANLNFSERNGNGPKTAEHEKSDSDAGQIFADTMYRSSMVRLLEEGCKIIDGVVYNSNGYVICGILNQHDKPCQRIGKCPFHPNVERRKEVHSQVSREDLSKVTASPGGGANSHCSSKDGKPPPRGKQLHQSIGRCVTQRSLPVLSALQTRLVQGRTLPVS